ncbi:MAG: DNA-directed DNA polymerase II small subunit [Thermoplasmata archaeon]|nr:MAG: DNA-directed DNA polymerase II small subunit [Thermoplasmata archaeon]
MERERVIALFQEEGMLIQPEAVDFLMRRGDAVAMAKKILQRLKEKPLILSIDDIKNALKEDKKVISKEEKYEEGEVEIEVIKDVTGKSRSEGKITDFAKLFRDRYERIAELLKRRQELRNVIPLKRVPKMSGEISMIGIVNEIRKGENGNVVEIEDESDVATCYIPQDVAISPPVVEDEVVGIIGKVGRRGLVIAQHIIRPDVSFGRERNYADQEAYVAFVSDIHIGSKTFLRKEWREFIKWLNGEIGNARQREVAKKVKCIVVPGDIVDGIGIYPNQEEDLEIEDFYGQYKMLAREMEGLPEHIKIIFQPGNHDAVRAPLPQPALEKDIQDIFSQFNTLFVGNPCFLRIDGVEILVYHGQAIQDFATHAGMDQNKPTEIMKCMLQMRHMAPIYGDNTPLAPEVHDYLVIDRVPDIFVTGHVHTTAVEKYRGILLINASAWQSQTEYQKMMNFSPDPAKVPLVNLKNCQATIMDFGS